MEWTQSINRPYNRKPPYVDDDRNHDDTSACGWRGGSWYSVSIAIPYRNAFQPEHSLPGIGLSIAVGLLL